jgi:hypothetical protein
MKLSTSKWHEKRLRSTGQVVRGDGAETGKAARLAGEDRQGENSHSIRLGSEGVRCAS